MKIFACSRSVDSVASKAFLEELSSISEESLAILREYKHSSDWKNKVENHFLEVDFVVFIIGNKTFDSVHMKWEYAKAKELNKQIVGIKLATACEESILYCEGFPVFSNLDNCYKYLNETYIEDRQLLLEQYKIMVSSTEKVTDQRMKVNNLFFTLTSSILSISLVVGKVFGTSVFSTIFIIILALMGFLVTFLWEKLILSYGKLNTGKFKVIDEIEKRLRTNMFQHEWKILQQTVQYESNTQTEAKIVIKFRYFILFVILVEILYILFKFDWTEIILNTAWIACTIK